MDQEKRDLAKLAQMGDPAALIEWNRIRQREGLPPHLPAIAAHLQILDQEVSNLQNCLNHHNIREVLAETFQDFFAQHGRVIPRVFWSFIPTFEMLSEDPHFNSLVFTENETWARNILGSRGTNFGREYEVRGSRQYTPEYASLDKLANTAEQNLALLREEAADFANLSQTQGWTREYKKWEALNLALKDLASLVEMIAPIRKAPAIVAYLQRKYLPTSPEDIRNLRRQNLIYNFSLLPDRVVIEQRSHQIPPASEPVILESTLYQDLLDY